MGTRKENSLSDGGAAGDGWKKGGKGGKSAKANYTETCNPNAKVKKLPQIKGKE